MPLQRIETVDEPVSRAHVQDKLFDPVKALQDDFRNLLICGDNRSRRVKFALDSC